VLDGIDALQSVLRDINTAIKDQELHEAKVDLVARVQDWKGQNINAFGNLLLFDVLNIIVGNSEPVKTVCLNSHQITIVLLASLCPNAINSITSISLTGFSYVARRVRRRESLHAIGYLDGRRTSNQIPSQIPGQN
jgi:hypothetical protein